MDYINKITNVVNIEKEKFPHQEEQLPRQDTKNKAVDDFEKYPWFQKIDKVLKVHHSALYNLQFFNPYIKDFPDHQYSELMDTFKDLSDLDKNEFLGQIRDQIKKLKIDILKENKDDQAKQIMPLMHIIMFLVTYFLSRCVNSHSFNIEKRQEALETLANEAHELRLLPLPYGLLTHELIEVLDSERVIPGLCLISKIAEDFPFIDYHSRNKEGQKTQFKNWHQDVFVFCSFGSKSLDNLEDLEKHNSRP